jgi:hypothetical protein
MQYVIVIFNNIDINVVIAAGCVEAVVPYRNGEFQPDLIGWAEGYIGSEPGKVELIEAARDEGVALWGRK